MGALALLSLLFATTAESKPDRPNVIFILADDMGIGDAACYGNEDIQTPNIDRLATEGMRFTEHYAGATVCGPSRSALMTGRHTGHAFQRGNPGQVAPDSRFKSLKGRAGRKSDFPLRKEKSNLTTLPLVFRAAGYRTACIGKWGLGNPGTPGGPKESGFDEFFGLATHVGAHTYHPSKIWDGNDYRNNDKRYVHDQYSERALEFITRNKERAFFLYLAFQTPHGPQKIPTLEPYTKEKSWPQAAKIYASQITRMDRNIGRLLDVLKANGLEEKTLVIFASDNGCEEKYIEWLDSNGPYRGRKGDLYEGGIRTPMIARWKGTIGPGTTSNMISAFWDFMPTFAELTDQPIPAQTDGTSLVPAFLGHPSKETQPRAIYFEWSRRDRAGQAVRRGDWKLIRWLTGKVPRLELFNLANDPSEETNLFAKHPEIVAELTGAMDREHRRNEHFPMPLIDR